MGKEIGIDFGTTNTIVSYMNRNNELVTMELIDTDETIIPTAIFFKTANECIIGTRAVEAMVTNPDCGRRNFKTLLDSPKKIKLIAANGKKIALTAANLTRFFLNELIRNVQEKISEEFSDVPDMNYIDNVIITVPAKFSTNAIENIKQAAINAGMTSVRLMKEPVAAAVAYMHEHKDVEGKNILVYDFGGGTFDISILKNENEIYESVYDDGIAELGGNNITDAIIKDMTEKINDFLSGKMYDFQVIGNPDKYNPDCGISQPSFHKNHIEIYNACNNKIKHKLASGRKEFTDDIPLVVAEDENGKKKLEYYTYKYTIDEVEKIIEPYIQKTIDITERALEYAVQNKIRIDKIIIAGGSSKLPIIKKMLSNLRVESYLEKYHNMPTVTADDDVTTLISRGAAIMANENFNLSSIRQTTQLQYGFEGKIDNVLNAFTTIIEENQNLPCEKIQNFMIEDDIHDEMDIKIYSRDPKSWDGKNLSVVCPAVKFIDDFCISGIPDGTGRILKAKLTIKEDRTIVVDANTIVGDKVISDNHVVKKGSNLI